MNVWVSHYLGAALRPQAVSAAGALARAAFAGTCRLGPTQLIVSHAMLDTLEAVLKRLPVTAPSAEMARDQVEAAAGSGYFAEPPSIILGGASAHALLDEEDAAVLNAAVARQADVLVTSNIGDFIRGPRARTETAVLSESGGSPDVVRLAHPKLPGGLLIASPFKAAGWLVRGERLPPDVATRFAAEPGP